MPNFLGTHQEAQRAAIREAVYVAAGLTRPAPNTDQAWAGEEKPVRIRMHHGAIATINAQTAITALERGDAVALVLADGTEQTF